MINAERLNDDVIAAIANNMELDLGDDATIKAISQLSVEQAFERFLTWHGIIGYSDMIMEAIDNIRSAEGL